MPLPHRLRFRRSGEAVASLPHRTDSRIYIFSDRRSEAWIELSAVNDTVVETLIKVFAIYGQAGCTSPSRVSAVGWHGREKPGSCETACWPPGRGSFAVNRRSTWRRKA